LELLKHLKTVPTRHLNTEIQSKVQMHYFFGNVGEHAYRMFDFSVN
jgi:hypothetical protein